MDTTYYITKMNPEELSTFELKNHLQSRINEISLRIKELESLLKSKNIKDNTTVDILQELNQINNERRDLHNALRILGEYER